MALNRFQFFLQIILAKPKKLKKKFKNEKKNQMNLVNNGILPNTKQKKHLL